MTELEKLKAENKALKEEQTTMFLLMDVILTTAEKLKENKLSAGQENISESSSNRDEQVGVLFDQIGKPTKESLGRRAVAFFESLK